MRAEKVTVATKLGVVCRKAMLAVVGDSPIFGASVRMGAVDCEMAP